MRAETIALRDSYRSASDGTPGGRVQRDIAYANHSATLTALTVAEDRLCFGRLDSIGPEEMHIGRLGIFDDGADGRQLLMDWRAPSARAFYVATAANPLDVVRRRHLKVRRRTVESVSDEYLDQRPQALAALGPEAIEAAARQSVTGESALLSALNAPRTGRMTDIVETIQAEQDRIIRADRAGVLVVQGGPGTGKTAVALHRTAYLLYTYREQLANRGVLIIGPNRTFLDYIGAVLPSLGENAVVLSTVGDLHPGVHATAVDHPEVAVIKGRPQMASIIGNAVLDRQRVPRRSVTVPSEQGTLQLSAQVLARAQERAWATRLPHNRARRYFLSVLLRNLTRQVAERHQRGLGAEIPFTAEDFAQVRSDLAQDEAVRGALAPLWPVLTAERLLSDLYASQTRLRAVAGQLSARHRELLRREPGSPWTVSDVPLLDEAAELLGEVPRAKVADSPDLAARREVAESVLEMLSDDAPADGPDLGDRALVGMISASDLAELADDRVELTSTAERAGADREWTYGHVVVDEAQELSAMAWRTVMRRCPVRSMTLVGDTAQTSDPAGVTNWGAALRPYVQDRWRLETLTINYRTPSEIARVADAVLAKIDPSQQAPEAVRSTGVEPWWKAVDRSKVVHETVGAVADELAALAEGRLAVLCPRVLHRELTAAIAEADLDHSRVAVQTVPQAKGLEFDVVVLVEPRVIRGESRRGLGDVYVALTRATQRLGVLYSGARPDWAPPSAG